MVNLLDYDIIVNEFNLQSRYYVKFQSNTPGKCMNPLIPAARSITVPILFFYKGGFHIK